MRTWTTQAVDVRHDPTIAANVADFLREYGVKHTVTSDRIMGCPHQEGIDYPMGELPAVSVLGGHRSNQQPSG